MTIEFSEEELRKIVKEEVEKSVRARVREMQGTYTSKEYLETLIHDILWDTLIEKIPDMEQYVTDKIDEISKAWLPYGSDAANMEKYILERLNEASEQYLLAAVKEVLARG